MKTKIDYFSVFEKQAAYCVQAAEILQNVFLHFDPFRLPQTMDELHRVEREADKVRKTLTEHLSVEFLPPIEREDILSLSGELDNVTDAVEETMRHLYMYNITSCEADALTLSAVVLDGCRALAEATSVFREFRKSGKLMPFLEKVREIEEKSDALYTKAVRNLYCTTNDPRQLLRWSDLYGNLENCCDAASHAAEVMETVMYKNA